MQISLLQTANSLTHYSHGIYSTSDGNLANQEIPADQLICGTFP
jgi:hypothetical protein